MSNSITYYNRYNVKDIYDIFNKNRVNKISLGTTNEYISYDVGTDYAYIYARKSSPSINSDTYKNYAYLKVNDTTYNFYWGYAYTYTENVSAQNTEPILIAYDFVNKISTDIKFNKVSISHNATSIDSVPQTVNVFSPVSYIIENGDEYPILKNEYSISKVDINSLLGGSTFADFTTYVSYSYLDPTKYDGIVYENGKDILSTKPINDIHVWSMSPGHDEIGFAYKDINNNANGNKKINAYAYIHCGDIVLNKLYGDDDKYIANNELLEFKYVPSAVGRPVPTETCLGILATSGKINSETGFSYICESDNDAYGQRLYDFVKCAYSYNLGEYNDKSFSEVYTHPSYRNNTKQCEFYEFIQGKNYNYTSGEEHVGIDEIDNNNVNTTYFITNVSNLPINIFDKNLKINFNMDQSSAQPPEGAGAGGTGSNYGQVSEGDTISNEESSLRIYAKNKFNNDWTMLGEINISVSIVVDSVTQSSYGAQSFTVKLKDLEVNYDDAKWAKEDTTYNIEYNMDDLYYTMLLDFDGQNGISFSATIDAYQWNVSNETDNIYINKNNYIRDDYNLVDHAIHNIIITVSLDRNFWSPK